jgi:tRNA A37 methylthiotransferase MiaB
MTGLGSVVPWLDLPFQHASAPVLRRMRRFGDATSFLALVDSFRRADPAIGVRSNVIVGFPGETEADVAVLADFLVEARLDAVGVFGYSDEEGTEGAGLPGKLDEPEITARVEHVSSLVEELLAQRAADRVGETVQVLAEERTSRGWSGRAAHQGPETDGSALLLGAGLSAGALAWGKVTATDGVDLVVELEDR